MYRGGYTLYIWTMGDPPTTPSGTEGGRDHGISAYNTFRYRGVKTMGYPPTTPSGTEGGYPLLLADTDIYEIFIKIT